ncbi:deoxyribonuclease-2-beta-like [Sander lucioperca]|uniref:Deoxyribonuclease-2-alpha n=1 Tax=Sander lucioperca TaxID=283035 RepID=A0A8C9ZMS9_SANLU|nr:deoxyribonuclease-2-beta-like [Sander lucioperca]XP_035849823.1 deoxyribonuclease-2-beta-like [Sander lucioperca]
MGVMWRIFLTVSLLCWSADGQVKCRDNNNAEVDWYIIYKVPVTDKTTGLEYLYIDSAGKKKDTLTTDPTYKPINHPNGVLANTLRPIFTTSMTDNFGFITYSDQPPGCNAIDTFGHSKGLVMMDKTTTGVWLLHSTPRFPFRRDQNKFWPDSGAKNAQTFICVTFNYNTFQQIGQHLLDINAFTFDDHIPNNFHENLKNLRRTENNNRPQRVNQVKIQDLTSAGGTLFRSIAKKQYEGGEEPEDDQCGDEPPPTKKPRTEPPPTIQEPKEEYDGDLYLTIAETYTTNVKVQTWCSKKESSYCKGPQVIRIKSVKTNLGNVEVKWRPGKDHSKWCVAKNNNNHLICIADVNRALSQYERPGGGLCFIHQQASELFKGVIAETEDCR